MAMKVWDVTTLGSTMLSLSTEVGVPFQASQSARLDIAGAESNCAIALASLGRKVAWLSKVGDSPVGDRIISAIRARGVDVSGVVRAGGRSELMFVESGLGSNRTNVVYDRAGAAVESLSIEDVDLAKVETSTIFHLTGITAALSDDCRDTLVDAIAVARRAGVRISFDVNYRSKLWAPAEARDVIGSMIRGVDLLFVGRGDLAVLWGRTGKAKEELGYLQDKFGIANVVLTRGAKGATGLFEDRYLKQAAFDGDVVSPIGAGDAFAAGVLYSLLNDEVEESLIRGCAMAALARESRSDYSLATVDDLERVVASGKNQAGKQLSR